MRFHGATFFIDKTHPITPKFSKLYPKAESITLNLHSNPDSRERQSPEITIFFDNYQEATNFKNGVLQAWEGFLRKGEVKDG